MPVEGSEVERELGGEALRRAASHGQFIGNLSVRSDEV